MNLDRVKTIYDEITKYEIKLAPDPRSLGPLYLQDVISTCRNYMNAVSRIQLEVHREKQDLSRALRASETEFEVTFSELLSNDERVRRLPSIEDRKATVNMMLRDRLAALSDLRGQLQDLEYVEKAVRHRHKELTSTMSEIKLQRSLIRDEIDSGAMYGDERKAEHERGAPAHPLGDDINEDELDALLNKEREATTPSAPEEPQPAKVEEPTMDEDEAVKAFLDGGDAKTPESEDFSEVFDRL